MVIAYEPIGTRESVQSSSFVLELNTTAAPEFIDVTDEVEQFVWRSTVRNGFVVVFSRHTTAAVIIQENEPLLLVDMADRIERFSPKSAHYRHNDFSVRTVHMHEDECPNGHARCQQLMLGASETIPVIDGRLALGEWQRIFVVELDEPKRREVLVQLLGI